MFRPNEGRSGQAVADGIQRVVDLAADGAHRGDGGYSMAVAPFSFFMRRRKMDSIFISKGKDVFCSAFASIAP